MDRTIRAGQALLGAILSDPAGQQHILDLVERDDMRRPWHGQVLAAMQRLRGRSVLPGPAEVYGELKNDPDLPRPVSHDAVPLANLMQATPRAAHAPAYAAMVIDGGVRTRLALVGSRMTQAAEAAEDEPLETALRMTGQARRELDACRARWEALPEPMRRDLPVPARGERDARQAARRASAVREEIGRLRHDLRAGARAGAGERLALIAQQLADTAAASASQRERQAPGHGSREARPQGPDAEAAGIAALRDLVAGPAQLDVVGDWLRPEDFAPSEHGELYAVMRDLNAAGLPVDPVTISWDAARRGVRADPSVLSGGTGAFAVAAAREVHGRAVLARVAQAGRDIQASTADPALPVRLLLQTADERLRPVERDPGPQPSREPGRDGRVITIPSQATGQRSSREPTREADPVPSREATR